MVLKNLVGGVNILNKRAITSGNYYPTTVEKIRIRAHLTHVQIAFLLNISVSELKQIESAEKSISNELLYKLIHLGIIFLATKKCVELEYYKNALCA